MGAKINAAAAVLLGIAGAAGSASAEEVMLSILGAPNTTGEKVGHIFAERVAELSGGDTTINVNASLFRGAELAPAVRDGRVPMAIGVHAYLSGAEPLMGITNLPGIIRDADDYWKVHEAFYGTEIDKVWESSFNSIALATGTWETNLIFTSKPLKSVEDFEGMKIRVSSIEFAKLISGLGASPTPLDIADIQPGLERGVIDGLITSSCYAYHQGIHNAAPNVSNWSVSTTPAWAILVNKDYFEGLSDDQRAMLRSAGAAAEAQMRAEYQPFVDGCIDGLVADGADYFVADDAALETLFTDENTGPTIEDWIARATEKGVEGAAIVANAREAANN